MTDGEEHKKQKKEPFTQEDHELLRDFIGRSTDVVTGNKLYMQIAKKVRLINGLLILLVS